MPYNPYDLVVEDQVIDVTIQEEYLSLIDNSVTTILDLTVIEDPINLSIVSDVINLEITNPGTTTQQTIQDFRFEGDITGGSGDAVITTTLKDVVTAGSFSNPTLEVDSKGRVISISSNPAGNVTQINDLSDVSLDNVLNNQVLKFDYANTQWKNVTFDLNSIGNFNLANVATNDIMIFDGNNWVNQPVGPSAEDVFIDIIVFGG